MGVASVVVRQVAITALSPVSNRTVGARLDSITKTAMNRAAKTSRGHLLPTANSYALRPSLRRDRPG
jgi:hypothetical protein